MPLNDIYATSVEHPFCKDADETPIRILLDTKVLRRSEAGAGGLTRHGTYEASDDGVYPPINCCSDCKIDLMSSVPKMPKYALANDNLILREPRAFRVHGAKLSLMTFTMLSLARMVVRKIVAEPYRKGPPSSKQKGLRCNTISFPQSRCRQLLTEALPAEPLKSVHFLADTISIALAGADVTDLDKATWA